MKSLKKINRWARIRTSTAPLQPLTDAGWRMGISNYQGFIKIVIGVLMIFLAAAPALAADPNLFGWHQL